MESEWAGPPQRHGLEHLPKPIRQPVAGLLTSTRWLGEVFAARADLLEHVLTPGDQARGTLADQLVHALGLGCRRPGPGLP